MHLGRFGLFLFILGTTAVAMADCPIADKTARTQGLDAALRMYIRCAVNQNDDDTQLYLARIYATGQGNVAANKQKALLFYHLSSENGNATAMVELAKLLTELDSKDETRSEITTYLPRVRTQFKQNTGNSFSGELLHPYALLMLAAEAPEAKWFYTTTVKSDPRAAELLKTYPIDPNKRRQVLRAASRWKQRKMVDLAREILPLAEFDEFYQALYPKKGLPDSFKRSQAVERLKSKLESRLK